MSIINFQEKVGHYSEYMTYIVVIIPQYSLLIELSGSLYF